MIGGSKSGITYSGGTKMKVIQLTDEETRAYMDMKQAHEMIRAQIDELKKKGDDITARNLAFTKKLRQRIGIDDLNPAMVQISEDGKYVAVFLND